METKEIKRLSNFLNLDECTVVDASGNKLKILRTKSLGTYDIELYFSSIRGASFKYDNFSSISIGSFSDRAIKILMFKLIAKLKYHDTNRRFSSAHFSDIKVVGQKYFRDKEVSNYEKTIN
jgi:hypothetical protein